MVQVSFEIAGKPVGLPTNAHEMEIELNYGKDQFPESGVMSLSELTWVRDEYELLMSYYEAGLNNTGVGITEAPSLAIYMTENGVQKQVFQGYISFKGARFKDKISITTKAISNATVDWLNEVAAGFTFEYLASDDFKALNKAGYIPNSAYVFVPYCLNQVPNYEQCIIATISIFGVSQSIYKEIESITDLAIDAGGVFTTVQAALQLIVKVAYVILLLAALIKIIEDTIKFLVSPVKYHAGMYVRDLLKYAADYLNMSIVCDIVQNPNSPYYNEIIIPPKLYNAPVGSSITSGSGLLGFLTPDPNSQVGWFKGTFADLLNAIKTKYNAKVVVSVPVGGATPTNQGTITIVRKDLNVVPPQYTLPNLYQPEYSFNSDEAIANYLLEFETDSTDMNTLQDYQGTICQVITGQKTVNYQPFVTLTDFQQVSIPFARASIKTGLTLPEQIIDDFLQVFDAIDSALVSVINVCISAVNKITGFINKVVKALRFVGIKLNWSIPALPTLQKSNLSATIENRIGMMMLSADHFQVAKILCIKPSTNPRFTKLDPNNATLESALAHWNGFHYVNSIVPKQINPAYSDRPYGAQVMTKTFASVPFTWQNFLDVVTNNQIFAPDGVSPAIMERIKFKPPMQSGSSGKAEIKVRFYQIWTLNLQETFLNPSGA